MPRSHQLAPASPWDAVRDLYVQRLAFDVQRTDLADTVDDGRFTRSRWNTGDQNKEPNNDNDSGHSVLLLMGLFAPQPKQDVTSLPQTQSASGRRLKTRAGTPESDVSLDQLIVRRDTLCIAAEPFRQ